MSIAMITKDRRFWPLFWTQFLGAANDNFFKNALVILITYNNVELFGLGASSLVALAGGIFILPYVTFSATAGQIADHYDKSDVIKVTKITELIIMCIAAVGFLTSNYALLLFVLFLMGAQSSFFSPVKFGSLPEILDEHELTTGNAFIGAGTFVAILIGTIVGGLSASMPNAFGITSVGVIGVAALGIVTAWFQRKLKDSHESVKIDYTFVKPTIEILKTTFKEKEVMKGIMGISWFWFFGAAILALIPALCKEVFHASELVGTMFLATFTIGMGVGAFVCNKLSEKKIEVGMVPIAVLGMSLFMFDLFYVSYNWVTPYGELLSPAAFFQTPNSIRAIFDLFGMTVFGGMYIIPQQAYLQSSARPEYLARTIAANNIWNSVFMVASAGLLMGLYAFKFSKPEVLGIMAVANLLFAFVIYLFYGEQMWRFVAQWLCRVLYKMDVDGLENIPEKGPLIVACNHASFVDWLFIMAISPRPVRFVIDHIYYYRPGLKFWFKQARLIPVATRKENQGLLDRSFDLMYNSLDEGRCIGIFPEGTVTKTGDLSAFQPGIKKVVDKSGAHVLPIVINGLWGSYFSHHEGLFKGLNIFKRRGVHLTVLPVIGPDQFCFKDLENIMTTHYKTPNTGEDLVRE